MSVILAPKKDSKRFTDNGSPLFMNASIDPESGHEILLPDTYKYTKWSVPTLYEKLSDRIHNFKIRHDDIWLIGFTKSGTTWLHNIIWQLKNNLDFSASAIHCAHNFLEYSLCFKVPENELFKQFDFLDSLPSPRIIKSHLPAPLLPKELWTVKPKIAYISRNPKDVAVSLFHFTQTLQSVTKRNIDVYFEGIFTDYSFCTPLNAHVLSFWEIRKLDNILFCCYEDLLADQFNGVKIVSEFLKCSYSDQQLNDLTDHVSFGKIKDRIPTIIADGSKVYLEQHRFCRKGKAGGYREIMTEEQIKKFDEWIAEQLKNTDFRYADC